MEELRLDLRAVARAPLFNYLAPSESVDETVVSLMGIEPVSVDYRERSLTQVKLDSQVGRRKLCPRLCPNGCLRSTSTITYGETPRDIEEKRDDRGDVDLSYVRYIGRQWFWAGVARFESNESMGVTLRSQLGGWVGRRLVNSNRARFEVGWGAVFNNENGVDTAPTQNVEGLIGFQGSTTRITGPRRPLIRASTTFRA